MKDLLRASAPIKHIVNDAELVPHTVDIEFNEAGDIAYRKDDGELRPFGGSGIEVIYETMPTPTAGEYTGKIVLYMGETDDNYTNKHFYLGTENRFHVFSWLDVSEGGIKKVDTMEDPTAENELVMYIGETTEDYKYRQGGIYESREVDGELVWIEQITESESILYITPDVDLVDGVTGQVMRHGNLIIFELSASSEDDFTSVAEAMPKPFPGSVPLFTANAGTDAGYTAKMTIDEDGILAFTDDEGFPEFSVSGSYFSQDFNEVKGWTLPSYEYVRDITNVVGKGTGIQGYVHRLGNQIEFFFEYNQSTALVNIATAMPRPTSDSPVFSAVTDNEASSLAANVELSSTGDLHFLDTDGYKSFTVHGTYFSKDFDEYMGFDVNSSRIPLYSDDTKDIRFGQDEDGYYGYYEPDSDDIHAFRDEGIDEASVGEIRAFAGACYNNPPEGWLVCKGQSVLRSEYPDLFAVISTTYGSVDDEHFTIPDLTNRFIQGGAADPDGQPIAPGIPNIYGRFTAQPASDNGGPVVGYGSGRSGALGMNKKTGGKSWSVNFVGGASADLWNQAFQASDGECGTTIVSDANQTPTYSNKVYGKSDTVQPPALKMVYLIRYKKVRVYEVPDFIDGSTVGEVKSYAGDVLPRNWLLCDGHEELVEEYPELYSVIKNKFGTPSAVGKFKLPDLTDLFIDGGVCIIRARKVSIRNEEEIVRSVNMPNDHTIEFGIDSNGNWGYKKDGADSVIPFKTGNGIKVVPTNAKSNESYARATATFTDCTGVLMVAAGCCSGTSTYRTFTSSYSTSGDGTFELINSTLSPRMEDSGGGGYSSHYMYTILFKVKGTVTVTAQLSGYVFTMCSNAYSIT